MKITCPNHVGLNNICTKNTCAIHTANIKDCKICWRNSLEEHDNNIINKVKKDIKEGKIDINEI